MKTIEVNCEGGRKTYAIVDDCDFEFLNKWHWSLSDKGYARRSFVVAGKEYMIYMHRLVLNVPDVDGLQGDHINGNRLDNRADNLRIVNRNQNARNRFAQKGKLGGVRFKGVYANRNCSTYNARIRVDGKAIYLGSFTIQEEAAAAYDAAAQEHFGEHAKLNFPPAPNPRPNQNSSAD